MTPSDFAPFERLGNGQAPSVRIIACANCKQAGRVHPCERCGALRCPHRAKQTKTGYICPDGRGCAAGLLYTRGATNHRLSAAQLEGLRWIAKLTRGMLSKATGDALVRRGLAEPAEPGPSNEAAHWYRITPLGRTVEVYYDDSKERTNV